jgi:AraC-like DNA-binding protein
VKVFPFKIPKPQNIGLIYQEDSALYFYDKLHQHEEIQLCTIIKGSGTLIVGDAINDYKAGDVLVIGSNLPHVFKSNVASKETSFMISLFFTEVSFGRDFFHLDDFKELTSFFKKSLFGCKLLSNEQKIQKLFLALQKASNLKRFIVFFEILKLIKSSKTKPLADFVSPKKYTDNEGKRMRNIMDYTIRHFNTDITLQKISSTANISPNAFCRYFKQRTNKTYFSFLNELRVDHACKLLVGNKELSISEIAFESGFQNLSNFNRKFKEVKKTTPSSYRKN